MHAPVGDLTIFEEEWGIVALEFGWGSSGQDRTPGLVAAKDVLEAYFDGAGLRTEGLRLTPRGSAYRQKVWAALRGIPDGQTRTYGEIVAVAGGSARSVGGANAANPIPILIPCHRVVGAAGIGGYSGGDGVPTKKLLLQFDQRQKT
jgi:methylated-DNA-[protein]-cysteine S-methyltransferase